MSQIEIHHVIVHTPEQAREIIREALIIADDFDRDSAEWPNLFREACQLLGARFSLVAQQPTVQLDSRLLRAPGGH